MSMTADPQQPNIVLKNHRSTARKTYGLWANLGAELVYTQDGTGRYLTFYWQKSESLELNPEQIVESLNGEQIFVPVDKNTYLERLQRILTSLVPERCQCWFSFAEKLYELELVISPIMPTFGSVATTVLVMGRLLQSTVSRTKVNVATKMPTQLNLA